MTPDFMLIPRWLTPPILEPVSAPEDAADQAGLSHRDMLSLWTNQTG